MAGESAREFARRQREKAERHARVAELYERGADGESATAAVLDGLKSQGWLVFHDVRWPGRPRANIDHVAVGPGGVFVIDSKHWTGRIAVENGVLRQNGRKRERAVSGVADAALAVTGVLGQIPATAVLCFVRDEPMVGWTRGVMTCSTGNLAAMLASRPPTLHPAAISRLKPALEAQLVPATSSSGGATPVTRRAASVPGTPAPARPPRTRTREARFPVAMIMALVAAAALVAAIGSGALRTLSDGVSSGVERVLAPTSPIGMTVTVDATSARPELEVTAQRPVNSRAVDRRAKPSAGNRLVVVHLRIKNNGSATWDSSSGTRITVVDGDGARHSVDPQRRKVAAGRLLPARMVLDPLAAVEGHVVFELPRGVAVSEVDVTLGPGLPKTVRWRVAD